MGEPSGEIVARPMVARACGCEQEFQHYAVDKYRAQRLAKFQKTRCANCVAKLVEEQRQAAALLPKKGEALQQLPPGTQIALNRRPDGVWAGTMTAGGKTVEATGDNPQGLTIALARFWVMGTGGTPAAKPAAIPPPAAKPVAAGVKPPPPKPGPPRPVPPAAKPPAPKPT
jgi:hypothetical protein